MYSIKKTSLVALVFITCILPITVVAQKPYADSESIFYGYEKDGKIIIKAQYREAYDFVDGAALVYSSDFKYFLIDTLGNRISDQFDGCYYSSDYIFLEETKTKTKAKLFLPVSKKSGYRSLYGFINRKGEYITSLKYEEVSPFSEGYAAVSEKYKEWYFIDITGKQVSPIIKAYRILPFDNGYAPFELDVYSNKWGYLNKSFEIEIPTSLRYTEVGGFYENRAIVYYDKIGYGFIDKNGKEIVAPQYYKVENFKNGYAVVYHSKSEMGLIDSTGKEVIPTNYSYVDNVFDGMCRVFDGKVGYINIDGKGVTIPLQYDKGDDFSDGCAIVVKDNKYSYVNKMGKEISGFIYDTGYRFFNGYAVVGKTIGRKSKTTKYGIINKAGEEVVPLIYDRVLNFSEGLFGARLNEKRGYIDATGKEVISFVYDMVGSFREGLAPVKQNGKWGVIDKSGKIIIPFVYDAVSYFEEGIAIVSTNDKYGAINTSGKVIIPIKYSKYDISYRLDKYKEDCFSLFARKYVEEKINVWQKKGEFESTANYKIRVNQHTRDEKINQLTKEAEANFIVKKSSTIKLALTLETYDADNEVFLVKDKTFGNLLVPVPINRAEAFKTLWEHETFTPTYFIENDRLSLAELRFENTVDNSVYTYSNQASLNYSVAHVDYNFDPIEIDSKGDNSQNKGNQNISSTEIIVGRSDVDINIPETNKINDKSFAVIIANEEYRREASVPFALNDGRMFKEYCIKTLGIPEQHVHLIENATLNDLRHEISWITNVMLTQNGEANVLFYYAGHGIPDEATQKAYLLPIDGYAGDYATGYSLDELYTQLGAIPAHSITYFIDACFSGAKREQGMLASARGVAIKVKNGELSGNSVVFSAANGEQTAYPYQEKQHGLFTYYLLKKLQETKGNVTYQELGEFITSNVAKQSVIINSKIQSPTVKANTVLRESWKNWKLK